MTLQALLRAWNDRDARYSYRKLNGTFVPVSDVEQESIRWWRRREANGLTGDDRSIALLELARWTAPSYTI